MKDKNRKAIRRLFSVSISTLLLVLAFIHADLSNVVQSFRQFPVWTIALICCCLGANLLIVSLRFYRVLIHFGLNIPALLALKASVSGYIASLFFISLFGQVAGRYMVLGRSGVPSIFLATAIAYERFMLFVIGGGLCILGAFAILDHMIIGGFLNDLSIIGITLTVFLGVAFSFWIGRSNFENNLLFRTKSRGGAIKFTEIGLITLLGQLFLFTAYVVGVMILEPGTSIIGLLAAVAIVSFAASLPISVNGWGVREIAAVYALGEIGVSSSNALAVSILIGLCSTLVIILASPIILKTHKTSNAEKERIVFKKDKVAFDFEKAAAWVIATATSIFLFYQVHVKLPGGVVNLNLADPFAVLALAAVGLHAMSTRSAPLWRFKYFNKFLVAVFLLLMLAFVNGAFKIGITQWALTSRLLGWLVLMGYMGAGYLIVNYLGRHGLRRVFETMIAVGVTIVVYHAMLRWVVSVGWITGLPLTENFEGFAGNRNAFAFQMVICAIIIMAYSTLYLGSERRHSKRVFFGFDSKSASRISRLFGINFNIRAVIWALCLGVIYAGIIFSASRAGIITILIIVTVALFGKFVDARFMLLGLAAGFVFWFTPLFAEFSFLESNSGISPQSNSGISPQSNSGISPQSKFSNDISDTERWESIFRGIEIWLDHPFIGAGLGVFIEQSEQWFNRPFVIHSTPVWILAEFGIFGLLFFLVFIFLFFKELSNRKFESKSKMILWMLVFSFVLFGLVHEVMYQRMFWFVIGAVLAAYAASSKLKTQKGG